MPNWPFLTHKPPPKKDHFETCVVLRCHVGVALFIFWFIKKGLLKRDAMKCILMLPLIAFTCFCNYHKEELPRSLQVAVVGTGEQPTHVIPQIVAIYFKTHKVQYICCFLQSPKSGFPILSLLYCNWRPALSAVSSWKWVRAQLRIMLTDDVAASLVTEVFFNFPHDFRDIYKLDFNRLQNQSEEK